MNIEAFRNSFVMNPGKSDEWWMNRYRVLQKRRETYEHERDKHLKLVTLKEFE